MAYPFPEHSGSLPVDPQAQRFFDQQREVLQDQAAGAAAASYAAVEAFQAVYNRQRQNYQLINSVVNELPGQQNLDNTKLQLHGLILPATDLDTAAKTARVVQAHTLWMGEPRREKPYYIVGQCDNPQVTELLLCAPNSSANSGDPIRQVAVWTDEFVQSQKTAGQAQFRPYTPQELQAMYDPISISLRLIPGPDTIRARETGFELKRPLLRSIEKVVRQKGIAVAQRESLDDRVGDNHMTTFNVINSLQRIVFALRNERTNLYDYLEGLRHSR